MKQSIIFCLLVLCFLVCGITTSVFSQDTTGTAQQTTFGIRSVGIQFGWYNPALDYWNDTYFQENGWENSFSGSFYYGAYFELTIIKNLGVRAGFNYWRETVASGEIQISGLTGEEELRLSLATIPIDIIYLPGFLAFEKFRPYVGIGGSFVFIQNKFSRQLNGSPEENSKQQGQDFIGQAIIGIERPIVEHFSIGIEFNYVFGKYQQEVKLTNDDKVTENVSVNGPKFGIKLSYDF